MEINQKKIHNRILLEGALKRDNKMEGYIWGIIPSPPQKIIRGQYSWISYNEIIYTQTYITGEWRKAWRKDWMNPLKI